MIHEENGQIIVDELQPMSDAKVGEVVLGVCVRTKEFVKIMIAEGLEVYCIEDDAYYTKNDFVGHIPLPIYRPKDGA